MKTIFVDVDDVCALLSPVWLGKYNKDFDDNLTEDKIHDWGTWKYVKHECGRKIYDYLLDPHLYDTVLPRDGSLEGVKSLRAMGLRVVFATSTPIETAGRKFYWLEEHGYQPNIQDYVEISDKSLLNGDYIFDDGFHNVEHFVRRGILLTRPWNEQYKWGTRVNNWNQLIHYISEKEGI